MIPDSASVLLFLNFMIDIYNQAASAFDDLLSPELMIAIIGAVAGPIIVWFAAKKKIGSEIRLIDIETLKGWREFRASSAEEIAELHLVIDSLRDELERERTLRREERDRYLKIIKELQNDISALQGED